MVRRIGGLDADVHSPSALSPAEERLLTFARVLLAAPRFVFIDRMGGELTREQVANIYGLLKESSITYLTIGDGHALLAYHDRVLEVQGEGRWRTSLAQGPDAVDGLTTRPSVSDSTSTSTPSGAHE